MIGVAVIAIGLVLVCLPLDYDVLGRNHVDGDDIAGDDCYSVHRCRRPQIARNLYESITRTYGVEEPGLVYSADAVIDLPGEDA